MLTTLMVFVIFGQTVLMIVVGVGCYHWGEADKGRGKGRHGVAHTQRAVEDLQGVQTHSREVGDPAGVPGGKASAGRREGDHVVPFSGGGAVV